MPSTLRSKGRGFFLTGAAGFSTICRLARGKGSPSSYRFMTGTAQRGLETLEGSGSRPLEGCHRKPGRTPGQDEGQRVPDEET